MIKTSGLMTGLKPISSDQRDLQVGALIDWMPLDKLPGSMLLEGYYLKDQIADGNDDFCASCAGAIYKEMQEGTGELYYPFLFAAAKYEEGDDPDSFGLELRSIGKALKKWGIPLSADVPQSVKNLSFQDRRRFDNYPESLREKALVNRIGSYLFINGPFDPFDDARSAIATFQKQGKKCAVLFGVEFGWPLSSVVLDGTPDGFGHCMANIGWFDGAHAAALNSAGPNAGESGIHHITRDAFNNAARKYGMLVMFDLPADAVQYMVDNKIKLGDNWLIQLGKAFYQFFKSFFV